MTKFRLEAAANNRLDEIADYTRSTWGDHQAAVYIDGLFLEFAAIAARAVPWKRVPSSLGIVGFRRAYRSHFIYWKELESGEIAIMTILHQRMQQAQHVQDLEADPADP